MKNHSDCIQSLNPQWPVLSIRQPWAWLCAEGFKDIENRTWATKYRGPFYIHTGKTLDEM